MNAPVILEEQKVIVEWAREMRKNHVSLSGIIELLVSNDPFRMDEKTIEVRKIYQTYNSYWKSNIIEAIVMDIYRLENDILEGHIVTNGNLVGFAYDLDLKERTFCLFASKHKDPNTIIGKFSMDDFRTVNKWGE